MSNAGHDPRKKAPRSRAPKKPIEPLGDRTLNGLRRLALNYLRGCSDDVNDVVQDVHLAYLNGEVPKDLLLRATKLRAIGRYRATVRQDARNKTAATLDGTLLEGLSYRDEDTGEVETVIVDTRTSAPGTNDRDPAIEAVAGLMVRGGRVRVGRGGRTIANPYRNEDRIVGRLAARQERERDRGELWDAIARLADDPQGRPNQKDRAAARDGLRATGWDAMTIGGVLTPPRIRSN